MSVRYIYNRKVYDDADSVTRAVFKEEHPLALDSVMDEWKKNKYTQEELDSTRSSLGNDKRMANYLTQIFFFDVRDFIEDYLHVFGIVEVKDMKSTFDEDKEYIVVMGEECTDEYDAVAWLIGWNDDVRAEFQRFCEPILYDTMIDWSRDDRSTVQDMRGWLEDKFVDHILSTTDDLREYLESHGAEYRKIEEESE